VLKQPSIYLYNSTIYIFLNDKRLGKQLSPINFIFYGDKHLIFSSIWSKMATAFFKSCCRVWSKYSLSKYRNSFSYNSQPREISLLTENLNTSCPRLRLIKLRPPSQPNLLDAFCLQNIKNCSLRSFKAISAKNKARFYSLSTPPLSIIIFGLILILFFMTELYERSLTDRSEALAKHRLVYLLVCS